jgi:hypothetical protein
MAEILTQRKGIGFNLQSASPLGLYVDGNDKLLWRLISTGVVGRFTIRGRLINTRGELVIINEYLDINSGNLSPFKTINLEEGFLQSLVVRPVKGTSVDLGDVFTIVSLVRGIEALGEIYESDNLIQNYVSSGFYPSYPRTEIIDPIRSEGHKRIWISESFGGQSYKTYTVPSYAYYRLIYVYFQVATSSVSNDRYYNVFIDDGSGNTVYKHATRTTVPANTITGFIFGTGENSIQDYMTVHYDSLSQDVFLRPGYIFAFRQYNYDSGDSIQLRVVVEKRMTLV